MPISKSEFSAFIKAFQFRELFNEMGWNNDRTKQPIVLEDTAYMLNAVAEKSGFKIFTCTPPASVQIPDAATRKKIEGKVTKLFQEHLIIFIDEHKKEQVWQLAVRKTGFPTKISETRYLTTQDPELLYQRANGLLFTLDEEEKVTIIDVTRRVSENFQKNNEQVTKKFYEGFKKEHTAFLKFIEGIDDKLNMDWYASLMLNRLMFCYFIQKKGFLDNNFNYLHDKLKACKEKKGKNQFYSFYRNFLLALFHQGLGAPQHSKNLEVEIGRVPYLNGGLFDEHEIEKTYEKIHIEDKAFERIFNFFDEYEWHLDTREAASGRDINPDVIGYIFEKYINDRAQMGAYYTKEDITDYISKNCLIPRLFDDVKREYPKAFAEDGWLWQMVKDSNDDYIYDAVKHGVSRTDDIFKDLPDDIKKGFNPDLETKVVDGHGPWLWELRKDWNKPAPPEIALPTELYREVIERRKRYADIKAKIANGDILAITDFITHNLNIRQFAQDVLETTEDSEFIKHFYKTLSGVTILDPTCGSGAFLFAALNILEPLYEACIQRMRNYVAESGKGKHKTFEKILAQVNAPEHPNLQYFIYKSIILNNLYGVDIMNEAVEIAKLRLFLKLVATVDVDFNKPNFGLEPLPDIDFNIRAGNTLIGYATKTEISEAFKGKASSILDFDDDEKKIEEQCDIVARAFTRYKEIQLSSVVTLKQSPGMDYVDFKQAKDDLNARLDKLTHDLDVLLHKQHYPTVKFNKWLDTHKPFHWYAEYYEIMQEQGGFDVIIGNPPYVEYKDVKNVYTIRNLQSERCADLYAFCTERALNLLSTMGQLGLIVPISIFGTDGFDSLQKYLLQSLDSLWVSCFSNRPSQLFDGAQKRLTIFIGHKLTVNKPIIYTTKYLRWRQHEFDSIFQERINYAPPHTHFSVFPASLEKLGSKLEVEAFQRLIAVSFRLAWAISEIKKSCVYYTRKFGYFLAFLNFIPTITEAKSGRKVLPSELKELNLSSDESVNTTVAVLSSSTFFWFWNVLSDCRNLNRRDLLAFPFDPEKASTNFKKHISKLGLSYLDELRKTSQIMLKSGLKIETFEYSHCKPIIDKIDGALAQHYGFTHEELDFIINYDIKYRMGRELDNGEDE